MLPDNDRIRLHHMLDAAERIIAFTENVSLQQFQKDEQLHLAVTRLLEILGEAANSISDTIRKTMRKFRGAKSQVFEIALFTATLM